ncbi:MAG: hypothetical protein AB7H97_09885 [Pseudobdellovibrionaceae bacterium]
MNNLGRIQALSRLFFLFLFVSFSACTFLSKAKLSKLSRVKPGQSQAEVVGHLGEPGRRSKVGKEEIFYYDLYSEDAKVYPYMARFENGALISLDSDFAGSREARTLREERRNSNQDILDYTQTNKAPPLRDAQSPGAP